MNNLRKDLKDFAVLLPTSQKIESYFDRLWPICRSITGEGFRQSLNILKEIFSLDELEFQTGEKVLDWTVPNEWNIQDAWIEDESGNRIVDFKKNNLHVVSYSAPVDQVLSLEDLQEHLHSLPDQPHAIPYLSSYYKERWGFCLTHQQRQNLKPGNYRAVVRSTLKPGKLVVGTKLIPSTTGSTEVILLSSYLCHPSLANNELSGPLTLSFLARAISEMPQRRYNYRIVIGPETIGSLALLSRLGQDLKENCVAGYVLTCCGDDRALTYKRSRQENSLADRAALNLLDNLGVKYSVENFAPHDGSDDRQYCSPGFNLPVGALMRSMYGRYPEYHTSLDDKSVISFEAMAEMVGHYLKMLQGIERNRTFVNTVQFGEPMLGPRGLYPSLGSSKTMEETLKRMLWLINYSDGQKDLLDIAERVGCSVLDLADIADSLIEKKVLKEV